MLKQCESLKLVADGMWDFVFRSAFYFAAAALIQQKNPFILFRGNSYAERLESKLALKAREMRLVVATLEPMVLNPSLDSWIWVVWFCLHQMLSVMPARQGTCCH